MYDITEFKGNKVITLKKDKDDKNFLSFGLRKAELILNHIDAIKKFVADNQK